MRELSRREQFLIYVLVCFLIAVAGWFVLLDPALAKNSQLRVQNDSLQMQLLTLQQQLKDYENAPSELEVLEESYNEIASEYNSIMTNDNIDKLLTTQSLAHGFRPKSMTIGAISDVTFASADETTDEEKTSENPLKQSVITMSLDGNLNNLKKLMNTINDMKGIELGNLSYQINQEKTSINLSFVIYMIQK